MHGRFNLPAGWVIKNGLCICAVICTVCVTETEMTWKSRGYKPLPGQFIAVEHFALITQTVFSKLTSDNIYLGI